MEIIKLSELCNLSGYLKITFNLNVTNQIKHGNFVKFCIFNENEFMIATFLCNEFSEVNQLKDCKFSEKQNKYLTILLAILEDT